MNAMERLMEVIVGDCVWMEIVRLTRERAATHGLSTPVIELDEVKNGTVKVAFFDVAELGFCLSQCAAEVCQKMYDNPELASVLPDIPLNFTLGTKVMSCTMTTRPYPSAKANLKLVVLVPSKQGELLNCRGCRQNFKRRLQVCQGCKTTMFCSVKCQRKDWDAGHKHDCQVLLPIFTKPQAFWGDLIAKRRGLPAEVWGQLRKEAQLKDQLLQQVKNNESDSYLMLRLWSKVLRRGTPHPLDSQFLDILVPTWGAATNLLLNANDNGSAELTAIKGEHLELLMGLNGAREVAEQVSTLFNNPANLFLMILVGERGKSMSPVSHYLVPARLRTLAEVDAELAQRAAEVVD